MEIWNEPTSISTYHKELRNFPKEKKYPKISQAKTSELPPSAESTTLW